MKIGGKVIGDQVLLEGWNTRRFTNLKLDVNMGKRRITEDDVRPLITHRIPISGEPI